ncbi:hypothetical protein [Rhizobacter sp. SG703]|uniref:hypothetical protein n=1 Tax=Rhizobacter sp. SG703 TaxID=2587140 RepID=UPI001444A6D6|nr:hypothetical protein [Rhizobacter sp. SG703]NKI97189.1 hypothetical protein [Rhizobacter sp. SG703]
MGDRPIRVNLLCAVSSLGWLVGFLVASYLWGWGVHLLVRWAGIDLPAIRHVSVGFMAVLGYAWILKQSAVHRIAGLRLGAPVRWGLAASVIGLSYVACVVASMACLAPPVALRTASHWSFDSLTLLLAGSLCLASRSLLPGTLFHIVSNLVVVSLPFADASALGGWGVASGWQMDVGPAGPAWMNWIEAAFCLAVIGVLVLSRGRARHRLQRRGLSAATNSANP